VPTVEEGDEQSSGLAMALGYLVERLTPNAVAIGQSVHV
jgi:hypothetical protein